MHARDFHTSQTSAMSKAPFILLVNPWIEDFAAYDLWSKPLGLLLLGGLLRDAGCGVALLDCLNRDDPFTNTHPDVLPGVHREFGTGKYPRMPLPLPEAYAGMRRGYYRYGIHPESFRRQIMALPRPDLVLVTSVMTYWYPGVMEAISHVKDLHPDVPVWLGGIYARLCGEHAARWSGADEVVAVNVPELAGKLEAAVGFPIRNRERWESFEAAPGPALELVSPLHYAPLVTGLGCPFHCPYCASGILQPVNMKKSAEAIAGEIDRWHRERGVVDFAFYDDALLLDAETGLKPVLEKIAREGPAVRFHTPNAFHVRALTAEWCRLLFESGFTTLRLGLETTRARNQKAWGGKVETEMFLGAVERLHEAGFPPENIGVYLLCGLPGQTPEEVAEAIELVRRSGAHPRLAEYSPVPGTPMWPEACALSRYDIAAEPLYHNNSFFACRRPDFTYRDLTDLKRLARRARGGR